MSCSALVPPVGDCRVPWRGCNVGGLLSSGSGEVWIHSMSVGLGLAEEKQCEWVDSAVVPQGEAGGKAEKRKP